MTLLTYLISYGRLITVVFLFTHLLWTIDSSEINKQVRIINDNSESGVTMIHEGFNEIVGGQKGLFYLLKIDVILNVDNVDSLKTYLFTDNH